MKNTLEKNYDEFFKLDPIVFRKIVNLIEESNINDGNIEILYSVTNKENTKYEVLDHNKVLNDDNTLRREIAAIDVIVRKFDEEKKYSWSEDEYIKINWMTKGRFSFENSKVSLKVQNIEDYKIASSLFDGIDNQIRRTLYDAKKEPAWLRILKWFFDKIDFAIQLLVMYLILILVDRIFQLDIFTKTIGELKVTHFIIFLSIGILIIDIFPYILTGIIERVESKFINTSIFYWGDVAIAYDKNKKIINNVKWIIIIGFVVSFLAGILTTLFIK